MNKVYFRACLFIILSVIPWLAHTAGLGKITLSSYLGQPLKAEIELVAVSKDEISTLTARVASPEAFGQAGISYAPYHSSLVVSVENRVNGQPYIQITSPQSIDEPFVNLLIELDGSAGRLLREYTVLLDPPESNALQLAKPSANLTSVTSQAIPETREVNQPRASSAQRSQATGKPSHNDGKNTYGPVAQGETLTRIARRVMPEGVDLNQMLLAIYQANKDAFFEENMNLLKVGSILRIPDMNEISTISQTVANREIKAQTANWQTYRQKVSDTPWNTSSNSELNQTARSGITSTVEDEGSAVRKDTSEEVLILSKGQQLDSQQLDENYKSGKTGAAQEYLRMLEEDAIAKDRALKEANERVAILEQNIERLQRLLELKSSGMAETQRLAEQASAQANPVLPQMPASDQAVDAAPETSANMEPELKVNQSELLEENVSAQSALADSATNQNILPDSSESAETALLEHITDFATDNLEWVGGAVAILLTGWLGISIFNRRREKNDDFDDVLAEYTDDRLESDLKLSHLTNLTPTKTKRSEDPSVNVKDPVLAPSDDSKFFRSEQPKEDLSESASEFFFGKNINESLVNERAVDADYDHEKIESVQPADIPAAPDNEIKFEKFEVEDVSSDVSTVPVDTSFDKNETDTQLTEKEPLSSFEFNLEPERGEISKESDSEENGMAFSIDFSDDTKLSSGSEAAKNEIESLPSQNDEQFAKFSFADIKLDLGDESEKLSEEAVATDDRSIPWDEVAVKIDLAKAYSEMDDKEGAREILEEVLKEGNDEQKSTAKTMLEDLK